MYVRIFPAVSKAGRNTLQKLYGYFAGNYLELILTDQILTNCQVKGRNVTIKSFLAFTNIVRLKKYGKKRLVIAH